MSLALVPLALLMWAVTYPSRALPLFAPHLERLPHWLRNYLRLIAPAVLSALAATNAFVLVTGGHHARLDIGLNALGVFVCIALAAWRRNLFIGLVGAVAFVGIAHACGLA